MARARDLAGLAALAGLAYMANRKKDETQNLGVDPDAATGAGGINPLNAREFGDSVDQTEAIADMGPRGSRAKVNPETGDLYYPEGVSTPTPVRAAAAAPVRARPNLVSREEGMSNYVPRRTPAVSPDYSNEGRTYQSKGAAAPAQAAAPKTKIIRTVGGKVIRVPDDSVEETKPSMRNPRTGRPYKKGGTVKKMASGGMSSASKRADGIASRGKTKCKMY